MHKIIEKMDQIILSQISLLPENLQLEVLHYIQFLVEKSTMPARLPNTAKRRKAVKPTFSDFKFQVNGQTFSRAEIYGSDGR